MRRLAASALLLIACLTPEAFAQPAVRELPPGVSVPAWQELSPEQQQRLAPLAKDWDRLPAWRRVQALERLQRRQQWQQMDPEQRQRMLQGARNFQDMPPELRERMRRSLAAVANLPKEQQRELRRIWQSLGPEQRREWLSRGGPGLSPPPAQPARRDAR